MPIQLSQRVQRIKPSATLAIAAKAAELRAQGKDVISLSTGEPDFDTPDHIKAAAEKAIRDGFTKYTAVDGIPSLKQAVCDKFLRENNLSYQLNQVLVSCGGKQSFFNLAMALLNPGDEVIIPAPYWLSYPEIVLVADGKPVIIDSTISQHYKITAEQLAHSITPKTRLVVINSPSNPTGIAYTPQELSAFAEVLLKHPQVLIATDDMYEHILWSKHGFANILNVCPELYERTIVLNGVSKAYAMTGWRIGYCAGPAPLIAEMKKVQSQSTSNPCSIAQKAAEEALRGDQSSIKVMLDAYKQRHDFVLQKLTAIPGVNCIPADGTFYSFPDVQPIIDKLDGINNDLQLGEYLLNKVGVAIVPGSEFGRSGSIRLSFATSMEVLDDALTRLKEAFA